jgi:hypothetical protein
VKIVLSIGAFLLLAVITMIVNKVLDDPITWAIARALGGVGPARSLSITGVWRNAYDYRHPTGRRHVVQVVQLRQFQSYVVGRALYSSSTEQKHRIRGRVQGSVFTGTWQNITDKATQHGSMQLVIRTDGRFMSGKWIGFDRKNSVQHGEWTWELLERPPGSHELSESASASKERNPD